MSSLNTELISLCRDRFSLGFKNQERVSFEIDSSLEHTLPPLQQDVLQKLTEICWQDGFAVLEIDDTGEVFMVERSEDGNCILWQVKA